MLLKLVLIAVAVKLALALFAAARGSASHRIVHVGAALASAATGLVALVALAGGARPEILSLPVGLPGLGAHFRLDALSAWVLLVAALGGTSASTYGLGYARHVAEPRRVLPFFPAFLAAIDLVLVADDAFVFLVAWETMSLASWLLVLANHREPGNAQAARIYLVMAVAGTACLLLAFGIMAGVNGEYRFAEMRRLPPGGWLSGLALGLVLVGAGSKAGLVPLHAWLPLAHPAAPSHVSALMSGVMTKVAIYALVRVAFDLIGPLPWGWGATIMALGALSATMGILYALMERDLKTLLAYSTVENVGIIVLALGLALVFRADRLPALEALAMTAALLHMFSHAAMKSLMFFAAGAVHVATGLRDLERLGGLIHRMPRTAAAALVGAAAIAALPPLNGFVTEWLVFQAVLNAPTLPQWPLKFEVPVSGAALALTAALAAACFVRAYGAVFLGRPRSSEAARADEVEPAMGLTMSVLALVCLVTGLLPLALAAIADPAVRQLTGRSIAGLGDGLDLADLLWIAPLEIGRSSYSAPIVLAAAMLATWAVVAAVHRFANARLRRGPAWDCGFPDPSPATQYTASSFAQPLRRVFGTLTFRARDRVDMPEPGETRAAHFAVSLRDPAWAWLYAPIGRLVDALADRFNALQYLTIRRYLVMSFATLVVMLSVVVLAK